MHRVFIIFFVIWLTDASASVLKHEFIEINAKFDLGKFKTLTAREFDQPGTMLLKSSGESYLKIRSQKVKDKTPTELMKAFKKNIIQYSLLFQERVSPYTGMITVNTECFDKKNTQYKIKQEANSLSTYFETTATKNFVYGKCDGDGGEYYSKYYIVLCKQSGRLYDVRFFTKIKNERKQIDVKCIK